MDDTNIYLNLPDEANMKLPDPELINFYEDIQNRIFWISGEISEDSLGLIQYILKWNREDIKLKAKDRKPIKLLFNSPGGSLDVAETLVSIIKLSKTPVYGFAIGTVASAASLMYLACHTRFALDNALFIFHKGSCNNIGGNYNDVQAMMDDYRSQVEKIEKFYAENTNYPDNIIKEKLNSDWYIHINEAMEYNVVNNLISDINILL